MHSKDVLLIVFSSISNSFFQSEAAKYSIKAMPTFVFFQHGKEVARLQGATKDPIEQTLKKFYKDTPSKDIGYVRRKKISKNRNELTSFRPI